MFMAVNISHGQHSYTLKANTEIYITGVGVNTYGEEYARIRWSGFNRDVYVYLSELIADKLTGSSRKALSSYYGLYKRVDDGNKITSYGIDAGDNVFLLAKDDGWCQVLYPTGSSGVWRIAWLEESNYNKLFTTSSSGNSSSSGGDDSAAREKVVKYAHEVLNYEWTIPAGNYMLLYTKKATQNGNIVNFASTNPAVVVTGKVKGVPYVLQYANVQEVPFRAFRSGEMSYENLSTSSRLITSNVYEYPYTQDSNRKRVSPKYGLGCATFVSDAVRRGFENENLSTYAGVSFHNNGNWSGKITQGSNQNYFDYAKLKPGDYVKNDGHVMLVVANDGSSSLTVIHQTPPLSSFEYNNGSLNIYSIPSSRRESLYNISLKNANSYSYNVYSAYRLKVDLEEESTYHIGTQKRNYSYAYLSNNKYYPMYVNYPKVPAGIKIDSANFPDYGFRTYISSNYDTNKDGALSTSEISGVTTMTVQNRNSSIYNVKGIEYFTNLKSLRVRYDSAFSGSVSISTLDLSGIKNLEILVVENTSIRSINVSSCTALKTLRAKNNLLTSINISSCTNLKELDISNNKFTGSLKIESSNLEKLNVSYNEITYLTVTSPKLKELNCSHNKISKLTCAYIHSQVLSSLNVSYNMLAYLDISKGGLSISGSYLNSVDFSNQSRNISVSSFTYTYYSGYQLNLGNFVGSSGKGYVSNIYWKKNGRSYQGSYNYSTGIATFQKLLPETVKYNYSTGKGAMTVTLNVQ